MHITGTAQGERERNTPSNILISDFDVIMNLQCLLDVGHYLEFPENFYFLHIHKSSAFPFNISCDHNPRLEFYQLSLSHWRFEKLTRIRYGEKPQGLRVCIALAEDLSLVSLPTPGDSQLPVTLPLENLMPSAGLLDTCIHVDKPTQTYT